MFFYISFLRPPPQHVSMSAGLVSFTPQIANDLRTELYENEIDIYYTWVPEHHYSKSQTVTPKKLTTWKGASSAYKAVSIPVPSSAKVGELWKIALQCPPFSQANGVAVQLLRNNGAGSTFGSYPLPILSTGIQMTHAKTAGKSSGNVKANNPDAQKQERIERCYILPSAADDLPSETGMGHRAMRITEQTSFDLDKKIWDSGLGLSAYLASLIYAKDSAGDEDPSRQLAVEVRERLLSSSGCNVVELGAGIGIVSLFLSALVEPWPSDPQRQVLATDLASALPLILHNIDKNEDNFPSTRLNAATLDWDEGIGSCNILSDFTHIDLIVMADVTYNTSSFPALLGTLDSLLRRPPTGESQKRNVSGPLVLLGYKERDIGERDLWRMAEEKGIVFDLMAKMSGAEDPAVEIWVGRLTEGVKRM